MASQFLWTSKSVEKYDGISRTFSVIVRRRIDTTGRSVKKGAIATVDRALQRQSIPRSAALRTSTQLHSLLPSDPWFITNNRSHTRAIIWAGVESWNDERWSVAVLGQLVVGVVEVEGSKRPLFGPLRGVTRGPLLYMYSDASVSQITPTLVLGLAAMQGSWPVLNQSPLRFLILVWRSNCEVSWWWMHRLVP